ncbi:hypothetical protein QE11421_23670 (plasmid) [Escherichia coli]|nr:hypothetical protein QE11421_23670 [Escherichia coli]
MSFFSLVTEPGIVLPFNGLAHKIPDLQSMLFATAIKAFFISALILKFILTCAIYHLVITTYTQYVTIQISSPGYAASAACKAALCYYIWHRSKTAEARRKPVLIDRFHLTYPQPCQTIPAFSHERASVRGRSGPDEGLPEVGAYLRVSGP